MNYYQLRIHDQQGKFIALIDQFEQIDLVRRLNSVGVLEVSWPSVVAPSIGVDYIIIVEFSNNGGQLGIFGETCYFVQRIEYTGTSVKITAYDALSLLQRRIVAHPSQTPYTEKSNKADDLIKEIVRENTTGERSLAKFTIENDHGLAPIVSSEIAWMPLLDALIDIAESSKNKGSNLYFDVLTDYQLNLTFRTYTGQRGNDRRSLILNGNHLNDLSLDIDWSNQTNAVYVGGSGSGEDRNIKTVIDQSIGQSLYGRKETFQAERNTSDDDVLIDDGLAAIKSEKIRFSGDYVNQHGVVFGTHFHFGDLVTCEAYGYSFVCLVDEVDLSISGGVEKLGISSESG